MNDISNLVYEYFNEHFNELPLDKQFHFASRLYVWRQDERCYQLLQQLRSRLLPDDNVTATLTSIASGRLIPLLPGNQNLLSLRQTYNERHPNLRAIARLLYWAAMLDQIYSTNARDSLLTIASEKVMQTMYTKLSSDDAAIAMLSTHAINFMHLYKMYYLQEAAPDPLHFGQIAANEKLYDLSDPLQIQLRIYLLTHTIIAGSMFYTQKLTPEYSPGYTQLCKQLEGVIEPNFQGITLDNKLEFLVCCQLVGYKTQLENTILDEAESSLSANGTYVVDKHNKSKYTYTSFEKSEHRNALYIMATSRRSRP